MTRWKASWDTPSVIYPRIDMSARTIGKGRGDGGRGGGRGGELGEEEEDEEEEEERICKRDVHLSLCQRKLGDGIVRTWTIPGNLEEEEEREEEY